MAESDCVAPVVALDIGKVCLSLNHDACARHLGFPSFRELLDSCPRLTRMALAMETGQFDSDEFFAEAAAWLETSPEQARSAWNMILGQEIPGIAGAVERARSLNLAVVFFSNVSACHFDALLPRLSFSNQVERGILSFEVGVMKPDARSYEAMEQRYCSGGRPALYLDDREENIAAAERRGWHAVLCTGPGIAMGAVEQLTANRP